MPNAAPSVYDELGHLVDGKIATEHYDIMWCIIGDAFEYSRTNCASIPPEESLFDFFRTELLERKVDAASIRLVLQMAESWGDFVGEPIEKQSLKFFWLEECIEGGMNEIWRTLRTLPTKTSQRIYTWPAHMKLFLRRSPEAL